MSRRNRKWVALAAALYLFVLWRAYRWGATLRLPDGNIFVQLERSAIRKQAEERERRAAAAAQPTAPPTGEARLAAAGPAYIGARYDDTHVVFIVATDGSRFSTSPLVRSGGLTKISAPARAAAPLAGLQALWEPDSQSLRFFPKIIQTTQAGEQWNLSLSSTATIPITIERTILAPSGCSLALGFLASVPPDQQKAFAASRSDYFVVRRLAVDAADPPVQSQMRELRDWKMQASVQRDIEQQLTERMMKELDAIDARLVGIQGTPAVDASLGSPRQHLKKWLLTDQAIARGDGKLEFDEHAFLVSPDSQPRIFVRARWRLNGVTVFLMTAWFRADNAKAQAAPEDSGKEGVKPALLFADSHWSQVLRESGDPAAFNQGLEFQSVLNLFDADHDGWSEMLVYSSEGASVTIAPYLYTDKALVPLKLSFQREQRSPESCLDP